MFLASEFFNFLLWFTSLVLMCTGSFIVGYGVGLIHGGK